MAEATNSAAVANNDEQTPIIFLDDIHVAGTGKLLSHEHGAAERRSDETNAQVDQDDGTEVDGINAHCYPAHCAERSLCRRSDSGRRGME